MKIITKIWVFFFSLLLSQDHWETVIFADDNWRYNVPDAELPSDWNTNSFNDGSWLYLYTIQAGEFRQTRKMVLLK